MRKYLVNDDKYISKYMLTGHLYTLLVTKQPCKLLYMSSFNMSSLSIIRTTHVINYGDF